MKSDQKEDKPMSEISGSHHDSRKSVHSTEELILQAAENEFLQKGFSGARTSSIAGAAGVTHAMLHYYFRTKELLFKRIIDDKLSLISDILISSVAGKDSPLFERIAETVGNHYDFISRNPLLPRFLINEIFTDKENMMTVIERMKKTAPQVLPILQDMINRGAERGECRRVDAPMLLLDIASLNIFSFLICPVVTSVFGDKIDPEEFHRLRKAENINTILSKLRL